MIETFKKGRNLSPLKYLATCKHCKCEFGYQEKDMKPTKDDYVVECPNCKKLYYTNFSSWAKLVYPADINLY